MSKNQIKNLIIVALVILNTVTLFWPKLARHSESQDNINRADFAKKFSLLDPNRQDMDVKDLIVNLQDLRTYLKVLPEQNKDWAEISIYFEVLNTGASVVVNPDLKIWPASLSKLPVGMVAMKRVEEGKWNLDTTKIKMASVDVDTATPDVATKVGQEFSLRFLLDRLLLESDNTAYQMILKQLTPEEFKVLPESIGLEELIDSEGHMSAKDYTRLFRSLYLATYLDEENSEYILELLQRSENNNFIGSGFPEGTQFAHKWGTHNAKNVFADSGIAYFSNRPVLISVMIQARGSDLAGNQTKAENLMKAIGQKVSTFTVNAAGQD